MPILKFAFDRSARRIDADGRLHVDASRISKANISPYYGQEIPGFEALGLDPQKVYRLYRDPVELERAADTFARLPILSKHVPVNVTEPQKDLIVGAIGSAIKFDAPYLVADICVWDAPAIAGIETDTVRELSCSYRYVAVMEPGEIDGQPYDGRMTEIIGNHLALVEVGRAGADVFVADSGDNMPQERKSNGEFGSGGSEAENIAKGLESHYNNTESAAKKFPKGSKVRANVQGSKGYEVIGHNGNMVQTTGGDFHVSKVVLAKDGFFVKDGTAMKKTKLGLALIAALGLASPVLAADSALPLLLGEADAKSFKKDDIKAKLMALDASLDSNKLDAVLDAILDVEQEPTSQITPAAAADESPADKLRAMLAGKVDDATIEAACALLGAPAEDEYPEKVNKKDVETAMDSVKREMREANEAANEVRATVGQVMGMDSAAEIYGFALDHMKVDRAGVEGAAALRALYRVASKSVSPAPVVALDSASAEKQFPGLARFGQV